VSFRGDIIQGYPDSITGRRVPVLQRAYYENRSWYWLDYFVQIGRFFSRCSQHGSAEACNPGRPHGFHNKMKMISRRACGLRYSGNCNCCQTAMCIGSGGRKGDEPTMNTVWRA